MKIAVICANGKAGKLIVKEAVSRGLDVTAVVREENQSAAQKVIQKDSVSYTHLDGYKRQMVYSMNPGDPLPKVGKISSPMKF